MQEIDSNKYGNDFNDEIDLRELISVLVQGKWVIAYVTAFLIIIGTLYSLLLPNIYQSKALLAPVDESSSLISGALSQFSGLAGVAGINLSAGEQGGNHKKAIELISSLNFFEKYLLPKIFLPDLMAIDSWDDKNNTIIYDESIELEKVGNISLFHSEKSQASNYKFTWPSYEDIFCILFTSGSSGLPKAVSISRKNIEFYIYPNII